MKLLLEQKDFTLGGTPRISSRYPRIARTLLVPQTTTVEHLPPLSKERGPVGVVGTLPERCNVTRDGVVTDLINQTTPNRAKVVASTTPGREFASDQRHSRGVPALSTIISCSKIIFFLKII